MSKHLIFFDAQCSLCQKAVQQIQKSDKNHIFLFFPLASERAKELLPEKLLQGDTMILLENETKTWSRSKAVFRILKLLEGKWSFLGFLSHFPGLDVLYRVIAHHRHFFDR